MFQLDKSVKFINIDFKGQLLIIESIIYLAVMRLAIIILPLAKVLRIIGYSESKVLYGQNNANELIATRVAWAVKIISKYTFWENTCLVQALSVIAMLKKRNIYCLMYLGVARDMTKSNNIIAHAWSQYGKSILTGEYEFEKYTIIAIYGHHV